MNIDNFLRYAGPAICRRAYDYYDEGRVSLIKSDGGDYWYTVHGTDDYIVRIRMKGKEVLSTSCDCPYGGMCKHVTACLLDIRDRMMGLTEGDGQSEEVVDDAPEAEFGLKSSELFVLSYLAFSGSRAFPKVLSKLDKAGACGIPVSAQDFNRKLALLKSKEWIQKSDECGAVVPESEMLVLSNLVTNHRDWLDLFEKNVSQPDYLLYLTDVAKVFCGLDVSKVHFFRQSYRYYNDPSGYLLKSLAACIPAVKPERIGICIEDSMICSLAGLYLRHILEYDMVERLEVVSNLLGQLSHFDATSASLYSRYRLAVFYARGEELPVRSSSENYRDTFFLDAAKSLLLGNVDTSISQYKKGLKIKDDYTTVPVIPDDPISFFLYVTALSIRHDVKDVSALSAILKKRNDYKAYNRSMVFPLVAFSEDTDQRKETDFIRSAKYQYADNPNAAQNVIAALTACFFGMKWEQKWPDPKMGLLRQECAAYFADHLSDAQTAWPYESVLHRIPVRPVWQLQIQDLIRQIDASAARPKGSDKACSSRMYYVASSYSRRVEVWEQKRLLSGAWGKGKSVSLNKYKTGDCPMDEIDKKIYETWLKGDPDRDRYYAQSDTPTLEMVAPSVVGTDKLAIRTRGPLRTVKVTEVKPYLMTERRNGEILFSSNVPEGAGEHHSMFMYWPAADELRIYPISPAVKPVYKRILAIGSMPDASESLLSELFASLDGLLEVHSEINGAADLESVSGNPSIIVRITPYRDCYSLLAIVRPLDGGRAEFFPGEGNAVEYDGKDGARFEVSRDLRTEKSNLKALNGLLPKEFAFSAGSPVSELAPEALLDFMDRLSDAGLPVSLEWPEGEGLRLHKPDTGKWEINAVGKGGWYELEGELSVSDEKVLTVSELLNLLRTSKERYVRLGGNEFLVLSDSLRRQLDRINAVAQDRRGKSGISKLTMALVGDSLSTDEMAIREPDALLKLRDNIRKSRDVVYDIPSGLNATLRYYQEEGFQWMMRLASWGAGACLADDMGLGKTVQAIAFLLAHAVEGPALVVAPASVVSNWQRELDRFAPSLNTFVLNGLSSDSRAEIVGKLGAKDVLILTYGLLVTEEERLSDIKWTTVCLDEAHTIKNRETKSSSAAMKLDVSYRLILTGTPVQNHLGELWNLFRFINPGLLGTYEQFNQKYVSEGGAAVSELKRIVSPFLLRRTKKEVARELPDKEEIVIPVHLSDEEASVYEVIRREAVSELENTSVVSVNALSMITKLRLAACASSLAEKKWTGGRCSKIEALMDKLLPIVDGGNSVLVFSQFTSFLSLAADALKDAGMTDFLYLDGSTPVTRRQKMVDSFQKGEHSVFLISLKAGGLGLNLTGANYVIHLDPWWNPAIEQQATDRAYRIGQNQKVTVYHLISSQTIEEKILRLHAVKRNLADSILEGSSANNKITAEELLEMLEK